MREGVSSCRATSASRTARPCMAPVVRTGESIQAEAEPGPGRSIGSLFGPTASRSFAPECWQSDAPQHESDIKWSFGAGMGAVVRSGHIGKSGGAGLPVCMHADGSLSPPVEPCKKRCSVWSVVQRGCVHGGLRSCDEPVLVAHVKLAIQLGLGEVVQLFGVCA